jgi:maltose alpha-D-glucosyltransferase / alpha-amylase
MEEKEDALWYKDAIFYEVDILAFYDSDDDGVGDFRGLCKKLDYIDSLGITALCLLPFYPSPLRDRGYDIADHMGVHPGYGTLSDFKLFLREAHKRGLRVVITLVLNQTSSEHDWFQRARRAKPGSYFRNFYIWNDTPKIEAPEKTIEGEVIFNSFGHPNWTWDPVARAWYLHHFYDCEPSLNYESSHVQKGMYRVVDFWLRLGVDGFLLSGVPYLYTPEGTKWEDRPETHAFLRDLREYLPPDTS